MKAILFDCNIYDKLNADPSVRDRIANLVANGVLRIIATPIIVDELAAGPFGRLPDWFPIEVEPENVFVLGFARLGMARLGDGAVYSDHRGSSNKMQDGIIADSADALADVMVSEDVRCRKRLSGLSNRCVGMSWADFCTWLGTLK